MLQTSFHQAADNLRFQFRGDELFLKLESITGSDLNQCYFFWEIMLHFSHFQAKGNDILMRVSGSGGLGFTVQGFRFEALTGGNLITSEL